MWIKKGLIFNIEHYKNEKIRSHGSIPFALNHFEDDFFIFFSSRNDLGKSLPYYVKAKINNGEIIVENNISPQILLLGDRGTFDDSGIMPCSALWHEDKIYLYYIGWNPQVTVSYRLSIGLAISEDKGETFKKVSMGPILDRDIEEPFFNTAPFVIKIDDSWKMWYISCTKWTIINDYPEPFYLVKSATSKDGIKWVRDNKVCIDYDDYAEAIGRPCVIKKEDAYEMYFSYRKVTGYRTKKGYGYKIGKAVSFDLTHWEKKYKDTGIELAENGWDNEMMEYCHVFTHQGVDYMLYNGNKFGYDGFGYAIRK